MMTLNRAIRLAQQWASGRVCSLREGEAQEYHKMALAAFRAQQEAEKNDPLTMEELRGMDGEKIYVHYTDGFYTDEDGAYFGKFEQLVRDCDGKLTACSLPLEYYSKTWLAYRHKPKEES